ncbi:hypothetical protein [Alteriqipengyuania sp. 357]
MDLPTHPLAGLRLAISETINTARVDTVYAIGKLDPFTEDALSQFAKDGGKIEIADCTCGVSAFPVSGGSCAWIMPAVSTYYHTYRLLHGIRAVCKMQEKPILVLRPQLEGAIARRDHYRDTPEVPAAWRHCSETCQVHGESVERAAFKGGLRNGVLTAMEDFTQELWDEGTALAYTCLPTIGGFCALFDVDADWAAELAYRLARFHDSATIAAMSKQELLNYLDIVEGPRGRPRPPAV